MIGQTMVEGMMLYGIPSFRPILRKSEMFIEQKAKLPSRSVWKCVTTLLLSDRFLTTSKEILSSAVLALRFKTLAVGFASFNVSLSSFKL